MYFDADVTRNASGGCASLWSAFLWCPLSTLVITFAGGKDFAPWLTICFAGRRSQGQSLVCLYWDSEEILAVWVGWGNGLPWCKTASYLLSGAHLLRLLCFKVVILCICKRGFFIHFLKAMLACTVFCQYTTDWKVNLYHWFFWQMSPIQFCNICSAKHRGPGSAILEMKK